MPEIIFMANLWKISSTKFCWVKIWEYCITFWSNVMGGGIRQTDTHTHRKKRERADNDFVTVVWPCFFFLDRSIIISKMCLSLWRTTKHSTGVWELSPLQTTLVRDRPETGQCELFTSYMCNVRQFSCNLPVFSLVNAAELRSSCILCKIDDGFSCWYLMTVDSNRWLSWLTSLARHKWM